MRISDCSSDVCSTDLWQSAAGRNIRLGYLCAFKQRFRRSGGTGGRSASFHLGRCADSVFCPLGRVCFRCGRRPAAGSAQRKELLMARIDLDLSHAYKANPKSDEDYALLPLKMTFQDGGAYALLGPSGCGKTTMLNIISGLLTPSQGSVFFDGVDKTVATPQERNIAQVFQFPVIYDTMTVGENLAFPLRNRKVPAARIKERVGPLAEMLEMSHQLTQREAGLAADAKQKLSLGRGLVRADGSAVLFDGLLPVIHRHLQSA